MLTIKALANHITKDVTGNYIQIGLERLRTPMQKITDFTLRSAGIRESATVTSINTGERDA